MLAKKLMALGGYTKAEDLERDYPTMESFVEAFPQAQMLINQYKKQMGGGQQDPLTQVITAVAEQVGIDPQQLAGMLQQSPEFLTQLSQMAAQDPNQAAQALIQVLQNASQGQQAQQAPPAQQQAEMAQAGQMPMNPEEAMQMAYGGASKLSMFTRRKQGGDIAFPQAAPMYDNSVYRTFPPNIPRLFQEGGENEEESFGPVRTPSIPMESYAQSQGLPEVTSSSGYNDMSSLKKNKNIGSIDGMTVSQVWTKVTGLPWSEAKKQGLTDGSYASNIALKKNLLQGVNTSKQASAAKNESFVRRSETPAGRSAMVNSMNEGYENRQGQRYIDANAPNSYNAPTRGAMDLYEAGLNYIDRNAAGVQGNMPPNRYVAPTPSAMDLYEAGQNYIDRNAASNNRTVVNTPRNLPFSYFSNPNVGRFVGRQPTGRVYAYGGGIPTFQVPPGETGPQVVRQDPSTGYPVVDISPVDIKAQGYRPPMLMPPPQVQYAEMNPWISSLGALGAASVYLGAGRTPFQGKVDAKMIEKSQMATEKGITLKAGESSAYTSFSEPLQQKAIRRYNMDHGTTFSTLKELPKEQQKTIEHNIRTLYDLNKKSPKQFNKSQRLMDMYPETALADAAKEHMGKSGLGRTRASAKSKIEGMPKGLKTFGKTAGWAGLGALIPYLGYKAYEMLYGPDQTEGVETTDYPSGSNPKQPGVADVYNENQNNNTYNVIDNYGGISDTQPTVDYTSTEKYGGNIYAYGGDTPFGYAYFAPPMAYGGSNVALPGVDNVDSELQMRNNTWLDYVRNNVRNASMPESFRKGGAKKKKG